MGSKLMDSDVESDDDDDLMDLAVLQNQVTLLQKDGNRAAMGYSDSKFVD